MKKAISRWIIGIVIAVIAMVIIAMFIIMVGQAGETGVSEILDKLNIFKFL